MSVPERAVLDLPAADLIARLTDTQPAPTICAWHEDLTTPRNPPATHGICPACRVKLEGGGR